MTAWTTSAIFGVVWLAIFLPVHIVGLILFWTRRKIQPITSRLPALVVGCDIVLIAFELLLCIQRIFADSYPCLLNLWSGFVGLLILFNTYMWRCWVLYFIFGVTQERLLGIKKGDSFFLKNRYAINNEFLVQAFGTLTVVLAWPCGVITAADRNLAGLRGNNCNRGTGDAVLAVYVAVYLAVFFTFAYKLRQVVDGFKIKEELALTGFIAIACAIPWIAFNNFAKQINNDVFPFSTFFLLLGVAAAFGLSTLWPLFLSYFAPPSMEEGDGGDLTTLTGLLNDKEGLTSFKQFLTKEFSVENILFYEEIEEYRTKKRNGQREQDLIGESQKIYAKYIITDSPFQVNLPDNITKDLEKQLKDIFSAAGQGESTETPLSTPSKRSVISTPTTPNPNPYNLNRDPPTIFDKAQENIFKLMNTDSFPRYARTNEYLALQKRKDTHSKKLDILSDEGVVDKKKEQGGNY